MRMHIYWGERDDEKEIWRLRTAHINQKGSVTLIRTTGERFT